MSVPRESISVDAPQLVEIDLPVVTGGLGLRAVGVKGDVDGGSTVENDCGEVLVEERLEQDDFVPRLEESGQHGIFA